MSDQENTDTTEEDTTETQDTTFNVGDYKMFFTQVGNTLLHLFVALMIGNHILYIIRDTYDQFMKDYYPTDENKSPFCHTKDTSCEQSMWYRDTNVVVTKYKNGIPTQVKEPYNPEFNLDIKKETNMTTNEVKIIGTYDYEYKHWFWFWWNNTFMKMNIYVNMIFKFMFEFISNIIDKDKLDFLSAVVIFISSWFFIPTMMVVLTPITICTFLWAGCHAYKHYSWVLMFPLVGAFFFGGMHLMKGNLAQTMISFSGILPSLCLHVLIAIGMAVAIFLQHLKFFKIYIWNLIVMSLYVIFYLLPLKIINFFIGIIGSEPFKDSFGSSYPKYAKMLSYSNEFSKIILLIFTITTLSYSYTYLTRGISIGMTICSIFLLFQHFFGKDKKE
jgi:hypothetical protein